MDGEQKLTRRDFLKLAGQKAEKVAKKAAGAVVALTTDLEPLHGEPGKELEITGVKVTGEEPGAESWSVTGQSNQIDTVFQYPMGQSGQWQETQTEQEYIIDAYNRVGDKATRGGTIHRNAVRLPWMSNGASSSDNPNE